MLALVVAGDRVGEARAQHLLDAGHGVADGVAAGGGTGGQRPPTTPAAELA